MAFLTIAGITVHMVTFDRLKDRVRGEVAVAFDNTLLDGEDLPMEEYEGTTLGMTKAEAAALRSAVSLGPVTCSGDMLDTSPLLCNVTVGNAPRDRVGNSGFEVSLSLTLRQKGPDA
jgi:hypothetical protein